MFKTVTFLTFLLISSQAISQTESTESEIDSLKKRVQELEEVQRENSEIIKRQLKDQHVDQNSRGYLEVKFGASQFKPKDIEDENDDTFDGLDDATWNDFGHAKIMEIELGKTVFENESIKHEVGIGYQLFNSKTDGSFKPTNGGSTIKIDEKVKIQTLYARYVALFKTPADKRFFIGPGVTLGYSPSSIFELQFEQDDSGEKATAEGKSYLVEVFGKAKYEFSRYFSIVIMFGYRIQEADELRLTSGDVVDLTKSYDLDASGAFGLAGLGVAF